MPSLPPFPYGAKPESKEYIDWLNSIQQLLGGSSGTIAWTLVDKAGANITDIPTRNHNNLTALQGGSSPNFYHLSLTQHTDLTDGGDSALHFHATDRDRANHTGTQSIATLNEYDTGTWTPAWTGLTLGGSAVQTTTGVWTRVGRLVFIEVETMVDTGTQQCVGGTTYFTLPGGLPPTAEGVCIGANVLNHTGDGAGHIDNTNNRVYPASFNDGNTHIITGTYRI